MSSGQAGWHGLWHAKAAFERVIIGEAFQEGEDLVDLCIAEGLRGELIGARDLQHVDVARHNGKIRVKRAIGEGGAGVTVVDQRFDRIEVMTHHSLQ